MLSYDLMLSSSPTIPIVDWNFSLTKTKLFLEKEFICTKFLTKDLTLVEASESILSVIHFINFSWSRVTPTAIISYYKHKT